MNRILRSIVGTAGGKRTRGVDSFGRNWDALKALLGASHKSVFDTKAPDLLDSIAQTLIDESTSLGSSAHTGECLEYILKNDLLNELVQSTLTDLPTGIKGKVLQFFTTLLSQLDDSFVVHSAVHKPLVILLKSCIQPDSFDGSASWQHFDEIYEVQLVELMCTCCSRIKAFPDLLPIFFHARKPPAILDDRMSTSSAAPSSNRGSIYGYSDTRSITTGGTASTQYEFVLFSYLLRFVHREGAVGDFARAGLLFLFDVAMAAGTATVTEQSRKGKTKVSVGATRWREDEKVPETVLALAEFLLESDFPDILAAGVNAAYGLLPSKLVVTGFHTLTEEDETHLEDLGISTSHSADFQIQLELFTRLIEFCQDVLQRAAVTFNLQAKTKRSHRREASDAESLLESARVQVASAITTSVLESIRKTFLENTIYPSLLECSANDGSAIAILSYLECLLSLLIPDSRLAHVVLCFLTSEDSPSNGLKPPSRFATPQGTPTKREFGSTAKLRKKTSGLVLLDSAQNTPSKAHRKQSNYITSTARFTVKDLIIQHLSSRSVDSISSYITKEMNMLAAMRLLRTICERHDRYSLDILDVSPLPTVNGKRHRKATSESTVTEEHDEDVVDVFPPFEYRSELIRKLISLGSNRASKQIQEKYQTYLQDATERLASNLSFRKRLLAVDTADDLSIVLSLPIEEPEGRPMILHSLDPTFSPILISLVDNLTTFLSNSIEVNLALTGCLITLASDPFRNLNTWFLPTPTDSGILYTLLLDLFAQLDTFRNQVTGFDKLLQERRRSTSIISEIAEALQVTVRKSEQPSLPSWTGPQRSGRSSRSKREADDGTEGVEVEVSSPVRSASPGTPTRSNGISQNLTSPTMSLSRSTSTDRSESVRVNLSRVLDNVVLLEGFALELTACCAVRFALGVD